MNGIPEAPKSEGVQNASHITSTEKRCNKCREIKALSDFYNHARHLDGKTSYCKECTNKSLKQYNQNHIDERSAMVRKWKKLNKEKTALSRRQDYEKKRNKPNYLIKNRIYWLVGAMLKRGEIEKPSSCALCNATGRIVAHHPDYNYPKTIIWVCLKCHHKVHN